MTYTKYLRNIKSNGLIENRYTYTHIIPTSHKLLLRIYSSQNHKPLVDYKIKIIHVKKDTVYMNRIHMQ